MTPPDLWGRSPVPMPHPDKRWLAVKDEPVFVKVTPPLPSGAVHEIDVWAHGKVEYRRDPFDEWSPPEVTLRRGCGDCEDIVILKRALLLRYGVPDERIYFLLVRDLIAREAHAVLLVDDGGWKIVDSYNALTLPVGEVQDYQALEAMQGEQRWKYEVADGA